MTRWVTSIGLLLLVVLTVWIRNSMLDDGAVKIEDRGEPDSQMWNFTRTEMDEEGQPKARLKAVQMKHFPQDDSVEFDKPRLEIFNPEGTPPWFIIADRGWLSGNGEELLLHGDVNIWRYEEADQDIDTSTSDVQPVKEIEMITADLKILLKEEYAETENFVTMINRTSKVTATGMQFDLQKRHLKLLKQVRGRYEN